MLPSCTKAPKGTGLREENQATRHFTRLAMSLVTGSSQFSTTTSSPAQFSKMRSFSAMYFSMVPWRFR